MKVSFTDLALADLDNIFLYIAADKPIAAADLADRLTEAAEGLADFPLRGRPGRTAGTRELLTVTPYAIVYTVVDATIEITRIHHTAQDR